jgi:hypothetical protein
MKTEINNTHIVDNNKFASIFCKIDEKASLLDSENIVWKWVDSKWIGKRSVWTHDNRACWLEETTINQVKTWWCGGKEADYEEIFTKE